MREQLDRAKALQRLFQRQMDKVAPNLPHVQRQRQAAKMMDSLVGPQWRDEVKKVGLPVTPAEALAAPTGPSEEMETENCDNEFWGKVKSAMKNIGDHPDGIEYEGDHQTEIKAIRGLNRLKKQLDQIIVSITQVSK